jgi:hypothetical protein
MTHSQDQCQERLNYWYGTYQTACDPKKGCMVKYDRCNDHNICGKLPVSETFEILVTSTFLSVDCLELKTDRMSSKLLHNEYAAICTHHTQVRLEYYYIGKVSCRWRNENRPDYHKAGSLICR